MRWPCTCRTFFLRRACLSSRICFVAHLTIPELMVKPNHADGSSARKKLLWAADSVSYGTDMRVLFSVIPNGS